MIPIRVAPVAMAPLSILVPVVGTAHAFPLVVQRAQAHAIDDDAAARLPMNRIDDDCEAHGFDIIRRFRGTLFKWNPLMLRALKIHDRWKPLL